MSRVRLLLLLPPLALAVPPAQASGITIAICGGGTMNLPVPGMPDRHDSPCAVACHAILSDRQRGCRHGR